MIRRKKKTQLKRRVGKNVMRKSRTSWLQPKTPHATNRAKSVATKKRKNIVVTVIASILISLILIAAVGILGFSAYSLKSGTPAPFFIEFQEWAKGTPLKIFFFEAGDTKYKITNVIGLKNVQIYPDSEFVFDGYVSINEAGDVVISPELISDSDGQALYTFISSGQSVYRLPLNVNWEDVSEFYAKALIEDGWEYVTSVPISDFERIPGEYYTKDGIGLHFYQVSYDIWYETITPEQASNGLQDKVVAYKAKEELVAAASGKNLPDETFWLLKYSRDWSIELQEHPSFHAQNVYFTHDRSKERITLVAVKENEIGEADLKYSDLESVGIDYIVTWLTTQPATVTVKDFSRTQLQIAGSKAVEFYHKEKNAHFLILYNNENDLFYVLQYIGTVETDFFQYIKDNLKVLKKDK